VTARPAGFDLLLTDVVRPEMSGPELAQQVRTGLPSLPVVHMSGYTDDVLGPHELSQDDTAFLRSRSGTPSWSRPCGGCWTTDRSSSCRGGRFAAHWRAVKRLTLVVLLCLAAAPAAAGATHRAYASQRQAEQYLEHGLKRWAGVNLRSKKYKFHVAFCLPGSRSKYERKHEHFPARGSHYHSFACTLAAADRVFHLYLQARGNGSFTVRPDR